MLCGFLFAFDDKSKQIILIFFVYIFGINVDIALITHS